MIGNFKNKIKNYSWYFPTVIFAVAIVGVFSTAYTYVKVTSAIKETMLEHVSAVANALEPHHIMTLSGSEADLDNPDYIVLKERLEKIRELSHDVRFIYLTGFRDGNPFFLADSEPEDSEDYSPPGQIYSEASSIFRDTFLDNKPIVEGIFSDRWGSWLTTLAPITNPENGEVIAVMGMDMNARLYYRTVYIYSALPAVAASFIILLIVIGFVIGKREKRFMEFKSELVSIASHEIRTPLTGVLWTMETLGYRTKANFTDNEKNKLSSIEEICRNLLDRINDLLLVSSLEKNGIRKLNILRMNIVQSIKQVMNELGSHAEKKSVRIALAPDFPENIMLDFDPEKMKMVFSNILDNAIKYSRVKSEVTISYKKDGPDHLFSIKDSGIGISDEDKSRIFTSFFRTENAKKFSTLGTGLGLYYVKKVIDLHKGKIWFESKENRGTTFYIEMK